MKVNPIEELVADIGTLQWWTIKNVADKQLRESILTILDDTKSQLMVL